jgi:hypothetical protein
MSIRNLARSGHCKAAQLRAGALSNCERWYAVHTLPRLKCAAIATGIGTFQPKRHKTVRQPAD